MLSIKFNSVDDEFRYYQTAIELVRRDIGRKETEISRLRHERSSYKLASQGEGRDVDAGLGIRMDRLVENLLNDNLREHYLLERLQSERENSREERIQELRRQVDMLRKFTGIEFKTVRDQLISSGSEKIMRRHHLLSGTCYETEFTVEFNVQEHNLCIEDLKISIQSGADDILQSFSRSLEKSNSLFMFFQGLRSYNLAISERQSLFSSLESDYSSLLVKKDQDRLVFSSKYMKIQLHISWTVSFLKSSLVNSSVSVIPVPIEDGTTAIREEERQIYEAIPRVFSDLLLACQRYFQTSISSIRELPEKRQVSLLPRQDHTNDHDVSHQNLISSRFPISKGNISQSLKPTQNDFKLIWRDTPRNVLIVKKPGYGQVSDRCVDIARYLQNRYQANIIIEKTEIEFMKNFLTRIYTFENEHLDELTRTVDYIVVLGGDGTVLHTSSLFRTYSPPILSFSLGSLGFLLPFNVEQYAPVIDRIYENTSSLLLRMRLSCTLHRREGGSVVVPFQIMNEVLLHRGREPHLIQIDCYINDQLLTNAYADGLIVATPTGSTAYSLSAGGPIVHPSLYEIILTPVCPRSLSFRPISLDATVTVRLVVSDQSRTRPEVSLDGKHNMLLESGEFLKISLSPYPLPTIDHIYGTIDWVKRLNELLKWNQNFMHRHELE